MDPHILSSIVKLLLIACGVAIFAEKLKQPYTSALVVVGLLVACFKVTPDMSISHDVIFTLILPPLLFYGAMHLDLQDLRFNWKAIAMLAVPGVVASMLIIGGFMHYFAGLPVIYAFLFGSLISPTDPISVISILKKANGPDRLKVILEGESLFNDGTGVVVFTIILGIATGQAHFEVGEAFLEFFKIAGGGTLVGIAAGVVAYKLFKHLNDPLLEVALTVVLVFGVPLLAETFHLSGVIAVVVTGLIIGNYGAHYSMSSKTRHVLHTFWEVIEFIINSLLFLLIGVELQEIDVADFVTLWKPIVVAIAAVLISRGIVVYPVVWFKNMISPDNRDIPWKWSHLLFWGGLKGSISIALVVGLPESMPYRSFFLTVAFAVVLFSLTIQALTMKPLIKKLGLSKGDA